MSVEPTQSAQGEGGGERRRLPRRDLVLLPLLVALTVAVVGGGAEVVSRILYPAKEINACLVRAKGAAPLYYKGGCASRTKIPEGPWVTNAYNACGSRTPEACGPKPAGAIRVAVVGSSTSAGYMVNYADSFAARASAALTKACRRPVAWSFLPLRSCPCDTLSWFCCSSALSPPPPSRLPFPSPATDRRAPNTN